VMGGAICLIAYALQRRTKLARELEQRAARLERERDERTRAAIAEERRRIARELHDVIAHTVSVMTVQAGAARLLLDDEPERAVEPLLAVEETGRQALAEIGRLLGILREGEGEIAFARRPGMADLDALVEHARRAGLAVEVAVEGRPSALAPGVDLAAYRIVQEALTNALKHSGPTHAEVTVRYGGGAVDLEIANDGRVVSAGDRGGHGLVGMRERAALYGGELEAGPRTGGGYAVRARLPVEVTT
jgi:signal transduction histidine kinase